MPRGPGSQDRAHTGGTSFATYTRDVESPTRESHCFGGHHGRPPRNSSGHADQARVAHDQGAPVSRLPERARQARRPLHCGERDDQVGASVRRVRGRVLVRAGANPLIGASSGARTRVLRSLVA